MLKPEFLMGRVQLDTHDKKMGALESLSRCFVPNPGPEDTDRLFGLFLRLFVCVAILSSRPQVARHQVYNGSVNRLRFGFLLAHARDDILKHSRGIACHVSCHQMHGGCCIYNYGKGARGNSVVRNP